MQSFCQKSNQKYILKIQVWHRCVQIIWKQGSLLYLPNNIYNIFLTDALSYLFPQTITYYLFILLWQGADRSWWTHWDRQCCQWKATSRVPSCMSTGLSCASPGYQQSVHAWMRGTLREQSLFCRLVSSLSPMRLSGAINWVSLF